ncbi:MAG: hypothetical protein K6G03_00290, partial [Lachnospiraceae bacterium]|nr:hypothetical protein [Lachnospiraceae bacterium]
MEGKIHFTLHPRLAPQSSTEQPISIALLSKPTAKLYHFPSLSHNKKGEPQTTEKTTSIISSFSLVPVIPHTS